MLKDLTWHEELWILSQQTSAKPLISSHSPPFPANQTSHQCSSSAQIDHSLSLHLLCPDTWKNGRRTSLEFETLLWGTRGTDQKHGSGYYLWIWCRGFLSQKDVLTSSSHVLIHVLVALSWLMGLTRRRSWSYWLTLGLGCWSPLVLGIWQCSGCLWWCWQDYVERGCQQELFWFQERFAIVYQSPVGIMTILACWCDNFWGSLMYDKFLWSDMMVIRWLVPRRYWCHSLSARITARSSLSYMS